VKVHEGIHGARSYRSPRRPGRRPAGLPVARIEHEQVAGVNQPIELPTRLLSFRRGRLVCVVERSCRVDRGDAAAGSDERDQVDGVPDRGAASDVVVQDLDRADLGGWLLEVAEPDDGSPDLPVRRITEPAPEVSHVEP
jgi:hypothetical protein